MKILIVFAAMIISCLTQRSPYAGKGPIGYPVLETSTTETAQLGNRFGTGDDNTTTTIRLPLEALGDAELVKRLLKLPKDQQPFWLINWQALEAHRNNPHTYPQRNNPFTPNNTPNNVN